jgi:serine/threonine protein kinase
MKDDTSIFGAKSDNLDRLLRFALEPPEEENQAAQTASLDTLTEKPGGRIDKYKLLRILGEGGMGIVYLAEQEEPVRRQVALKVIKPGMDSKRVIARFEAEKQALALMQHPNIAGVYDAGLTLTGRPYFVMEYVKGMPITGYCDHHKLTIEERLRLFQQVCQAVQHAHQKGIIHRDIKPSNVLVSVENDQAIPKIIDFGVAKATGTPLTDRTLATEDTQLLGTPEYMSPEQADMTSEDIDTRSDIYSLGVLLYVMLTGVLPFNSDTLRAGGIDKVRKVIRETDPKTPSTRVSKLGEKAKKVAELRRTETRALAKHLKKELEWIPLKAMRKERAERYRSASEFADDIDNYLNGVPLIAGPLSNVYRLKKFVRRNRVFVTGVAAIIAVLAAGVVMSTLFALRAQHQARISEAYGSFLRDDLLASVSPARRKGRDVTVRSLLDTASERLEGRFQNEPLLEASLRDTLGWTYRELDEPEAAETHLERALQIYKKYLGPEHRQTLSSMNRLAWLRVNQGQNQEAAELLEEGLAAAQHVFGSEESITLSFANTLGCVYKNLGRCNDAEQLYLKTIPIAQRVLGSKNNLSLMMVGNLGQIYEEQGRYDEAEQQYLETLRLSDGFWDDENVNTLVYKDFLAQVYVEKQQYEDAKRIYLEILPIQRRINGEEHWRTLRTVDGLARVYTHRGKYTEAEKLFEEELEALKSTKHVEHPDMIRCMNGQAELFMAQSQFGKAVSTFKEALEISRRILGDDHPWSLTLLNGLAVVYKKQAHYKEAEQLLLEVVEGRRLKLGDKHPHTIESMKNLIDLYEAWNKPEKAKEWREKLPPEGPNPKQ